MLVIHDALGILNHHPPDEMPAWARSGGSFVGMGHHEPSASVARRRITAFFDRNLRG